MSDNRIWPYWQSDNIPSPSDPSQPDPQSLGQFLTLADIFRQSRQSSPMDYGSLQFNPGPVPNPFPMLSQSTGTPNTGDTSGSADSSNSGYQPLAPYQTAHPKNLNVSDGGIDFIKSQEKLVPASPDPIGIATIGYGHKIRPDENLAGKTWDDVQATNQLHQDAGAAADAVRSMVHVPLTQDQFDMLTSLVYNVGAYNFKNSHVLENLNDGDYLGAATEMLTFDHAGGKIQSGLTTRRRLEAEKFLGADAQHLPPNRPEH